MGFVETVYVKNKNRLQISPGHFKLRTQYCKCIFGEDDCDIDNLLQLLLLLLLLLLVVVVVVVVVVAVMRRIGRDCQ